MSLLDASAALARRLVSDARSLVTLERRTHTGRSFGPLTLARLGRDAVTSWRRGALAVVHAHAVAQPDRPALVSGDRHFTYAALDARANRLTHALFRLGVRAGDRVGLLLKNGNEFFELHVALSALGAIGVQIGYRLKADEVAYIATNAGLHALFFDASLGEIVDDVVGRGALVRARAIATRPTSGFVDYETFFADEPSGSPHAADGDGWGGVMIYTSGTTGRGKGARRDFSNMGVSAALAMLAQLPVGHDERHLVCAPLYHSLSSMFTGAVIGMGGCVVVMDHFEPEAVLQTIERERITSVLLVPTMMSRLLALPDAQRFAHDTRSLRWIMSGAAPLPTETARGIEDWLGPILYNLYGATETGLVTLALPGEHVARPGTIGRAIPGNDIVLLGSDGNEVGTGEVGELYVGSRMAMDAYHGDESATRDATRDGRISVGDLAYRDADGYYFLADRKTDMVISGGVNIYPWEIEQRLHEHPAVADVAVIGVPDAEWGESIVAWVVKRADVSAEALTEFVRTGLADYKKPRAVRFVDELPRNPTGKILKRELKARWAEGRA